jgi:isopenicillin-N epimerase
MGHTQPMDRRGFLVRTGLTFAAAALAQGAAGHAGPVSATGRPSGGVARHAAGGASGDVRSAAAHGARQAAGLQDWEAVRDLFPLTRDYLHFGGLFLASHPAPVREAIEAHRRGLDENPVHYYAERGPAAEAAVLRAAASYLGAAPTDVALTDSTTMGLGLLYHGLAVRADQDVLTTTHDFSATHEALRTASARTGASVRRVRLYANPASATADEIVESLADAVRPNTRVVAVTWVHSGTGVKLPIRRLADRLAELNRDRAEGDRALLCVDGVHGLGVEDVTVGGLGADFLVAGCHKWLFGPRGTGIVWGHPRAWPAATPTIPSFTSSGTPASAMTPGGFHSFEHRWALDRAFALHEEIGKARVAERVHALIARALDGLATMPNVTLHTPRDPALHAGLACFDVAGLSPQAVVARLRERRIIATTTPYSPTYARLAPGLLTTSDEVDTVLREIRALS